MSSPVQDLAEPVVLALRPELCLAAHGGAVVGIHRAPLRGNLLVEVRRALESARSAHADQLVCLSVFRLSRKFPLAPGYDQNVLELADTLRAIERTFIANATLIEFGGVRAAAMRLASHAVRALARPSAAMADFDRLSEAVAWLAPHARKVGAPADLASWVTVYRHAEKSLASLDGLDELEGQKRDGARPRTQ